MTCPTWGRYLLACTVGIIVALAAVGGGSSQAKGGRTHWYSVALAHGTTAGGYLWSVGAKGSRNSGLHRICAVLSITEPPQEGSPDVEGTDSVDCGPLRDPTESVISSLGMGEGPAALDLVEVLYRPAVRKVVVEVSAGQDLVFHPRARTIRSGGSEGAILRFRYLAIPLEGDNCIRQIVSYDRGGHIIKREMPERSKACLAGS